jgi:thimet oligopeptidase
MDRKGLTLNELETLLHEMGHALHNNLSSTRYTAQAGTSVLRDFVEAPSQMLEDWVYDKNVLKLFAQVCPSCKPVPDEMIDKGLVARDYAKGVRYARQHLFASFDLALHAADAPEPMALWAKMEGADTAGPRSGHQVPGRVLACGRWLRRRLLRLPVEPGGRDGPAHGLRRAPARPGRRHALSQQVLAQVGSARRRNGARFPRRETNSKAFFDYLRK